MKKKISIVSPYEIAKQAGVKSVKAKKTSKTNDRRTHKNHSHEGDIWETDCSPDAFDAHPLAEITHKYGSSLRGGKKGG